MNEQDIVNKLKSDPRALKSVMQSQDGQALLNMLSGGIDSPVAAYRMAKRGLALDHIHFASPPYTSERAKLKVKALAQKITPYTGSSNLFVVPYTKPQEYIRDNAPDVLFTVLMRRSMMRIANVIAKKQGCEALVTGESLAQVASQTVKALQCTDAAQDLPILRPLIGMDKTEIVETARHINTFETSILPYEDCCTIFTPPHPKIRPELEEILEAEAAMPGLAAWEAIAAELEEMGLIRDAKSARRWRNKIVNDMAVCMFGKPAAVGVGTYRKERDKATD